MLIHFHGSNGKTVQHPAGLFIVDLPICSRVCPMTERQCIILLYDILILIVAIRLSYRTCVRFIKVCNLLQLPDAGDMAAFISIQ